MFGADRIIGFAGLIVTLIGTALAFYMGIKEPKYADVCWRITIGLLGLSAGFVIGCALVWKRSAGAPDPASIQVLYGNEAMLPIVDEMLTRNPKEIRKVIVVQHSGVHVVQIVREILRRTDAEIELFLAHPSRAVNSHQANRIKVWADGYANELRLDPPSGGKWHQFMCDAPGSIRAVLIEGQMLFVGAYFYQVVDLSEGALLDCRGGEMPLFAIPAGHPDFEKLAQKINTMVENWKEKKTSKGTFVANRYPPLPGTAMNR